MHTNKGYIIPVILIFILLLLAGIFIFSQKQVQSPVVEETQIPVATSTDSYPVPVATSTDEIEEVEIATTTASTTIDSSVMSDTDAE